MHSFPNVSMESGRLFCICNSSVRGPQTEKSISPLHVQPGTKPFEIPEPTVHWCTALRIEKPRCHGT